LLTFVAKDLVYYFFYFLLPLTLGTLVFGTSTTGFLLVLSSYTLAFLLGVTAVFLLSTLYTRLERTRLFTGLGAITVLYYFSPLSFTALNPAYLFYTSPSITSLLVSVLPPLTLLAAGIHLFGYETRRREKRAGNLYAGFRTRLPPLTSKNLVDMQRSSGGYGKILVSFGILFAVFWFLTAEFPLGELFFRAPLLSLAALLGMASASIYNWLNRFDSLNDYLHLPLDVEHLTGSKVGTFTLIGVPLMVAGDVLGFLILPTPVSHLAHAVMISLTSSFYLLAVLVHLTGLEPNTMMFDFTVLLRFLLYSSVLLVPYLILSMLYVRFPVESSAALATLYILSLSTSYLLLRDDISEPFKP
ncbi:MAG: hypothetical protein ABEI07_01790, partial [Candidatus Nanohaloarchaea archaeon]